MIKAILFDLDNTLIDFYNFKTRCVNAAVKAMIKAGLKVSIKKADKIIWKMYRKKGMEYQHIFQDLIKEVSGKADYRLLAHALNAYRKERDRMLAPYPKVLQTLKKLKRDYKLALISDAPKNKVWMRLVFMKADCLFDVIITFDDTHKKKPDKKPFEMAVKKLKLKPEEVLMVGDSISKDMQGAKKVGMKTVLALYGRSIKPRKNPESTDFMIKRIDDIFRILKSC
jgi:putative hydrolase of the HAD superfamily